MSAPQGRRALGDRRLKGAGVPHVAPPVCFLPPCKNHKAFSVAFPARNAEQPNTTRQVRSEESIVGGRLPNENDFQAVLIKVCQPVSHNQTANPSPARMPFRLPTSWPPCLQADSANLVEQSTLACLAKATAVVLDLTSLNCRSIDARFRYCCSLCQRTAFVQASMCAYERCSLIDVEQQEE